MSEQVTRRSRLGPLLVVVFAALIAAATWLVVRLNRAEPIDLPREFVGSASCRECHEKFYKLWSTSHHGLAMQPYGPKFIEGGLSKKTVVKIGERTYRPEFGPESGLVVETGPEGETRYQVAHAMGGKNVYYFLTPMEKGRLQVLPIAYDLRDERWYDTAASGVRHFQDGPADQAVSWRDPAYTFNTSCYNCHVSQLTINYDQKTDAYRTVWSEPGINCETCHGPCSEHVRVCRAAPEGQPPADLKLIVTKDFTADQHNSTCAPCHAKMSPITSNFRPGDRYFDHYDLVTLESPDFYPDGRDLGENYTYTSWRMSPCVKSGKLDCMHCHTSSGRNRFAEPGKANNACLPCHKQRVENPKPHTRHKPGTPGGRCVDCHMPKSSFARMMRTDHSMLPPTPAATVAFKSPNACNMCHTKKDEDAAWADKFVRQWRSRDYQEPVLRRAGLIAAARKEDWSKLAEMAAYVESSDRDEIFATSLIRLLSRCRDSGKLPALVKALEDPSPLVRSAAVTTLGEQLTPDLASALLDATEDDYRIVRIRAAGALAAYPRRRLTTRDRRRLERATDELVASLARRPDDWASHYNMGNHLSRRGDTTGALTSFQIASRLRPDAVPPLVNAAMAHATLGHQRQAEATLRKALGITPASAEANFNLGLLLAEKRDLVGAEKHLRAAVKAAPKMADAAYNLSVLLSANRMPEALVWARKAADVRPDSAKYAYMLALLLDRSGDSDGAIELLNPFVDAQAAHAGVHMLLGSALEKAGKTAEARAVYRKAISNDRLAPRDRAGFRAKLAAMGDGRQSGS